MSSLEIRGLTVRYGAFTAVDGVDLIVPDGTVTGAVGGSGSGQSTLGKAVVGLAPIASGRITADGVGLPRKPGRGPVQRVFQNPYASLDPRTSIGSSIAEALPPDRRADRTADVARYLDLVGLDPASAVVRYLSDQVAVLDQGRVVECGPTGRALADPDHETTRTLMSCIPALPSSPALPALTGSPEAE